MRLTAALFASLALFLALACGSSVEGGRAAAVTCTIEDVDAGAAPADDETAACGEGP
jgi:hypothetical protein